MSIKAMSSTIKLWLRFSGIRNCS